MNASDDPDMPRNEARRLTERLGFPPHALISGIPMGMLATATGFDVASQFTANPCSDFPRPAFWLIVLGLGFGVASGFGGLVDLLRIDRSSPAFRVGTWHVALTDLSLLAYGASLLARRGSDYCLSVGAVPFGLSIIGGLLMVGGTALGARLTYRYRVESLQPPHDG